MRTILVMPIIFMHAIMEIEHNIFNRRDTFHTQKMISQRRKTRFFIKQKANE